MIDEWKDLAKTVNADKLPTIALEEDYYERLARAFGITSIPLSYRTYFEIFPWGKWGDNETILPPTIVGKGANSIYSYFKVWDEYVIPEVYDRYIAIANTSIAELDLCWDRTQPMVGGELPIYLVDVDTGARFGYAGSLYEIVVDWWQGGKINDVYPRESGEWDTKGGFTSYI